MNNFKRNNLRKLVKFLQALPEDYEGLCMGIYAEDETDAAHATPEHPCGTPACLVGHGPSAGIPLLESEYDREGMPKWGCYVDRVFVYENDWYAFSFMFAEDWPNSIAEGVARIEMVLNHSVPTGWTFNDRFAE